MSAIIGDAQWEARGGRLSRSDRWRYTLAAVRGRLARLSRALSAGDAAAIGLQRIDLDEVIYPDSAFAKAAAAKMQGASSAALANHCYRTYVWGSLLGQLDGKQWDPELLFAAAMLHDLGLTQRYHGHCSQAHCFTLDAVTAAKDVLSLAGEQRSAVVRRAILLHLNVSVPGMDFGWEAHYLQSGAALDVVGSRYGSLPRAAIEATLARYPRLTVKDELIDWALKESQLRPHSRFALLCRLGFLQMIAKAPFAS